jgi:hypothetical protein
LSEVGHCVNGNLIEEAGKRLTIKDVKLQSITSPHKYPLQHDENSG